MTTYRLGGVIIGFIEVVFMIGPSLLADLGGEALAQFAILTTALTYGFAGIFDKRFKGLPALDPADAQHRRLARGDRRRPCLYSLFPHPGAGRCHQSDAGHLPDPDQRLTLGAAFLDEQVTLLQLGGMAAIGLGLALIDGRPITWLKRLVRRPSDARS